jgi:hypothetical protein
MVLEHGYGAPEPALNERLPKVLLEGVLGMTLVLEAMHLSRESILAAESPRATDVQDHGQHGEGEPRVTPRRRHYASSGLH